MQLWGLVLEEKGESVVNHFTINSMVIVKDEDDIFREGGDFIEQMVPTRIAGEMFFDTEWGGSLPETAAGNIIRELPESPRRVDGIVRRIDSPEEGDQVRVDGGLGTVEISQIPGS